MLLFIQTDRYIRSIHVIACSLDIEPVKRRLLAIGLILSEQPVRGYQDQFITNQTFMGEELHCHTSCNRIQRTSGNQTNPQCKRAGIDA